MYMDMYMCLCVGCLFFSFLSLMLVCYTHIFHVHVYGHVVPPPTKMWPLTVCSTAVYSSAPYTYMYMMYLCMCPLQRELTIFQQQMGVGGTSKSAFRVYKPTSYHGVAIYHFSDGAAAPVQVSGNICWS